MKMRVSITREFDMSGDHEELFQGINDKANFALSLFAEDMDYLVKYNEVKDHALLEVIV